MSIVIDTPYRSTRGRKPSRPAFAFELHNDAAGGTSLVDAWGNAPALTLQGTLGTAWTASRGFWRPNGTDAHAIVGSASDYPAQTVMGDAVLNGALFVAWRLGWVGTKTSSTECVLCVGRNNANSAWLQVGHNSSGIINVQLRGLGASTTVAATFGSSSLYAADQIYSCAVLLTATESGVDALGWLNGASAGTLNSLAWTANGGAKPALSAFSLPDGITVGAQRSGSNPASPSFAQRLGATAGGGAGTILANLRAINLAQSDVSLAADLALEMHQYPRAFGEVLARI